VKAALGVAGVTLGFTAALIGIIVLAIGLRRRDERILASGRRYVFLVMAGALLAAGAMEWALISHDFTLSYVATNGSRSTPLLYTISSLWGALQGSILLWALVLAGYMAVTARHFRNRASDPIVAWATITQLAVAVFFFGLMLGPANPFHLVKGLVPIDGRGPNPLLQNHPLMAFHPPMLYLGYVGFTIPFSFAIAALVTGRVGEGWLVETRRATLMAWGFLTVGIILGAWWSYEVLGWGGYWAWDPVENASFIPWLTATAYLHSVMVQERRGMLRVWNLSLLIATFCLTILGTFLTRSGVINSVHAFSESSIGPLLLGFLGLAALVGVGLIGWRGDRLRAPGRIDSPLSREAAFLANNLLFAAFAFVVLLGTVFPLVAEAMNGKQLSVGEPYFDRMTKPIGLALLFFMAVAPALPWRAASGEVLRSRLIIPAWVGGLAMVAAVLDGVHGIDQILAFGFAAFALSAIVRQIFIGLRARRRATGENPLRAFTGMVAGNRRLYGGLLVHVGVVLIAVAFTTSSGWSAKKETRLAPGQAVSLRGFKVTYLGVREHPTTRKLTLTARLLVEEHGKRIGVYAPSLSVFPNANEAIGTPSVRTGFVRDLYLTLVAAPNDDNKAAIAVRVNPMVLWLWIGGAVMATGTITAAWPSRRRRTRPGVPPRGAAGRDDPRDDPTPDESVLEGAPV
jgi:cytochrome c-type biogenesis protein CcmF